MITMNYYIESFESHRSKIRSRSGANKLRGEAFLASRLAHNELRFQLTRALWLLISFKNVQFQITSLENLMSWNIHQYILSLLSEARRTYNFFICLVN